MDDTWKHSKKESSSKSSGLLRSFSQKNSSSLSSSSSKFSISRSHSLRTSSTNNNATSLLRSSSTKSSSPSSKHCVDVPSQSKHSGSSSSNITRKYSSLAKEHKARFYIMRRCVAMLVCWHKHGD